MEEFENPEPNPTDAPTLSQPEGVITPFGPPSGRVRSSNVFPSGRVEANTALLKIGQNTADVSGFEHDPMDGKSGITPAEDDDGGEAASARIAQEYRRQVRIKRLAEEITQAERAKKKEDEQRRKIETSIRKPRPQSKKEETAKFDIDQSLMDPADSEATHAKKRAAAMDAFKTASTGHKSKSGLLTALVFLIVIGALASGAWMFLNSLAAQKDKANTDEVALRAVATQKAEQKSIDIVKTIQAHEAELVRQKTAAEEAARTAEAEKTALEELYQRKDLERQKLAVEATAKRIAEERRMREEIEKLAEQANRETDELRKKVAAAQRAARENMEKQEAERENAKTPVPPADMAKADLPKPDSTKLELLKPEGTRVVPPKSDNSLSGDVKTIPSDPPVVPGKIELPSGGVRLLVKASDPYGGKLTFQWHQLKGSQVDIADPAASKFVDGKWISQTYFVARQPGNYEFEVTVKNDEGVESRKKFPIEVLPPTTLK